MTTNEMTVTKALSELKLLDKRIHRNIDENDFIGFTVGKNKKVNHTDIGDFVENVTSKYKSTKDLITRRNKVKSAIVASNAVTEVEVAGENYTVAEAIERKTSIDYERSLLNGMKRNLALTSMEVDKINEQVKHKMDDLLDSMFSNENKKNNQGMQEFIDSYNNENQAKIVDPLEIKKEIEKLETSIEDFLAEVDEVLSVSNATTIITID